MDQNGSRKSEPLKLENRIGATKTFEIGAGKTGGSSTPPLIQDVYEVELCLLYEREAIILMRWPPRATGRCCSSRSLTAALLLPLALLHDVANMMRAAQQILLKPTLDSTIKPN